MTGVTRNTGVRLLALLLLLGGILSGCGLPFQGPVTDKTRIRFSTWGSAQEVAVLNDLIVEFEGANPDIDVELMHIPENYFQKIHILVAGGMMPDVVFTNSINFPVYAAHGLFADLTPWLEQSETLSPAHFYRPALETFDLRTGDPGVRVGAIPRDLSNLVLYYNKDLFREGGVALPQAGWTWDDFLAAAKALTRDTDGDGRLDQFGVSFYRTPPLYWMPFVWSAGGRLFDETRRDFLLNEPAAIAGLRFYADLPNRHRVAPRKTESGAASMSQWFLQQKLAMMVSGRWSVPVLREQAAFDWDVAPLPAGPAGSRTGIDASGYAMAAGTEHPQAAWALIEFLSSPEAVGRFTESGLIIPARLDVAHSDVFLDPRKTPQNGQVFLDAIETGVPTRSHPRWNEIAETLMLALDPVWDGKTSPEAAVADVTPRIEKMLEVAP